VDPDRPSGSSPKRFLCVDFWSVKTIAVCMSRAHGAVSSFRECGLPCGLRGTLCTLHLCRSACTSFTDATLGRSDWLDLPPQGLTPCKKRQASLGALTPAVSRRRKRERSGRCRRSAPVPCSAPRSSDLGKRFLIPLLALYMPAYLITLSTRIRRVGGIVIPRASAVFRLRISVNFVGCSTGRSAGFAPLRILST
jgi:hypothetical protein